MKTVTSPFLLLSAALVLTRDLGPVSLPASCLAVLLLAATYCLLTLPDTVTRAVGVLAAALLSGLASRTGEPVVQLCVLTGFAGIMFLCARLRKASMQAHALSLLSLFLFTIIYFLYRYLPQGWYAAAAVARVIATACSFVSARDLALGPTCLGLPVLAAAVSFHLSALYLSSKRSVTRLAAALLLCAGGVAAGVHADPVIGYIVQKARLGVHLHQVHTQCITLALLSLTAVLYRRSAFRTLPLSGGWVRGACAGFVVVLWAGALFTVNVAPVQDAAPVPVRVSLYRHGALDWNVPRFGTYGQRSGGMFGLLPRYLNQSGFRTRTIETISPAVLAETDVLVMINLNQHLNKAELFSVWEFVRHGGGLLLLGDHTDIAGSMKQFNRVLARVPLSFRFDSAMPARYTWDTLLATRPHPAVAGFDATLGRSWWVGASLDCRYPARPLVVGKYCYSDPGDHENVKHAYLGNRRYEYGEPRGDLVLAAAVPWGRGEIIACGDTSAFHNTVLMTTHAFVRHCLQYLSGGTRRGFFETDRAWPAAGAAALLVAGAAVCGAPAVLPLGAAAVLAAVLIVPGQAVPGPAVIPASLPTALIDRSHHNRFDLMSWQDDSIGGLKNNLHRNGLWPFLLHDLDDPALAAARALIIIAPARHYNAGDIAAVRTFAEAGGAVLICAGYEESGPVRDLLDDFGCAIENVPLGRATAKPVIDGKARTVMFHEAWPVAHQGGLSAAVPATSMGYGVVVQRKIGNGSVTVIGDSSFLLNENLEGAKKHLIGNILFLRFLLQFGQAAQ